MFSLFGGVFSLVGGVGLLLKKGLVKQYTCELVSFTAGVLLTTAFLGLLPESLELAERLGLEFDRLFWWPLLGMIGFFFLERSFFWFHHHHESEVKPPTNLLLFLGDSLHNFVDGILITSSFLVSIPVGIATALGVAAHEIPQEIADFGIFLKSGMKPAKVFWLNLLSALMTTAGAIAAWYGSSLIAPLQPQLIAFTAGMFIYIAASDLIPELHHKPERKMIWRTSIAFLAGILIMFWLIKITHGMK